MRRNAGPMAHLFRVCNAGCRWGVRSAPGRCGPPAPPSRRAAGRIVIFCPGVILKPVLDRKSRSAGPEAGAEGTRASNRVPRGAPTRGRGAAAHGRAPAPRDGKCETPEFQGKVEVVRKWPAAPVCGGPRHRTRERNRDSELIGPFIGIPRIGSESRVDRSLSRVQCPSPNDAPPRPRRGDTIVSAPPRTTLATALGIDHPAGAGMRRPSRGAAGRRGTVAPARLRG